MDWIWGFWGISFWDKVKNRIGDIVNVVDEIQKLFLNEIFILHGFSLSPKSLCLTLHSQTK